MTTMNPVEGLESAVRQRMADRGYDAQTTDLVLGKLRERLAARGEATPKVAAATPNAADPQRGFWGRVADTGNAFTMGMAQRVPGLVADLALTARAGEAASRNPARAVLPALGSAIDMAMDPAGRIAGTSPGVVGDYMRQQTAGIASAPPGIAAELLREASARTGAMAQGANAITQQALPERAFDPFSPEGVAYSSGQSMVDMGGSIAGSTVGTLVGGPAGAMAGAFAPTFASEAGSNIRQSFEAIKAQNPGMSDEDALTLAFVPSVAAAIPSAALDAMSGGEAAVAREIVQAAAKGKAKSLLRQIGKGALDVGRSALEEGLTEPVQGTLSDLGQSIAAPNGGPTTGEDVANFGRRRGAESLTGATMGLVAAGGAKVPGMATFGNRGSTADQTIRYASPQSFSEIDRTLDSSYPNPTTITPLPGTVGGQVESRNESPVGIQITGESRNESRNAVQPPADRVSQLLAAIENEPDEAKAAAMVRELDGLVNGSPEGQAVAAEGVPDGLLRVQADALGEGALEPAGKPLVESDGSLKLGDRDGTPSLPRRLGEKTLEPVVGPRGAVLGDVRGVDQSGNPTPVASMTADQIRGELGQLGQPTGGILPVIRKRLEKARASTNVGNQSTSTTPGVSDSTYVSTGSATENRISGMTSPNLTTDTRQPWEMTRAEYVAANSLLPAMRDTESGRVWIGKRNDIHATIETPGATGSLESGWAENDGTYVPYADAAKRQISKDSKRTWDGLRRNHEAEVVSAYAEGKPVPANVLAEYGLTPDTQQAFRTNRGSVYKPSGAGTTRTKYDGTTHPASDRTVYVSADAARELVSAQSLPEGTIRMQGDKLITSEGHGSGRRVTGDIPYDTSPQVGLHPVEVWNKTAKGEVRWHVGDQISEVTPDTTRAEPSRTTQETSHEVRQEEGRQGRQGLLSQKGAADAAPDYSANVKRALTKRGVRGDAALNAMDLASELKDNGAEIDADGMVTLYHRTSPENAANIEKTGVMRGEEDGVFFSTAKTGQADGYGNSVVRIKAPIESVQLDDAFGNEAHVRIPTKRAGASVRVSVVKETPAPATPATTDLTKLPLAELRRRAKAAGLDPKGTRGEILSRLEGSQRDGQSRAKPPLTRRAQKPTSGVEKTTLAKEPISQARSALPQESRSIPSTSAIETSTSSSSSSPNSTPREPWQMTRYEWLTQMSPEARRVLGPINHRGAVLEALVDGKPVPENVVAEYPGIRDQADAARKNAAEAEPKIEANRAAYAAAEQARKDAPNKAYQKRVDANIDIIRQRENFARDEAWKKTKAESVTAKRGGAKQLQEYEHAEAVRAAVEAGKPVPPEVLADYPDLAKAPRPEVQEQAQKPSEAKRARPVNAVVFETPIKGKTGAELNSYEWRWKEEAYVDERSGEEVKRRESDWEESQTNEATGREIVHLFNIKRADGTADTVSLETALRELGYLNPLEARPIRSIASSLKTLALNKMELARAESEWRPLEDARVKASEMRFPEDKIRMVLRDPFSKEAAARGEKKVVWEADGAEVFGETIEAGKQPPTRIPDERRMILESEWRDMKAREIGGKEAGWYGRRSVLASKIRDLRTRIGKLEKRLAVSDAPKEQAAQPNREVVGGVGQSLRSADGTAKTPAAVVPKPGEKAKAGGRAPVKMRTFRTKEQIEAEKANRVHRPFSRADLESRIAQAYDATPLGEVERAQSIADSESTGVGDGSDGMFSFPGPLPADVLQLIDGRPQLRRVLRANVPRSAGERNGADYLASMGGDRWLAAVERAAGAKLPKQLEALRNSPDPEHRFLAAIYDNLPAVKNLPAKDAMKPDQLPAGTRFEINGEKFEVMTDKDGYRVLKDGEEYPVVPVEMLSEIPVDKGTMKKGKARALTADEPKAPQEIPSGVFGQTGPDPLVLKMQNMGSGPKGSGSIRAEDTSMLGFGRKSEAPTGSDVGWKVGETFEINGTRFKVTKVEPDPQTPNNRPDDWITGVEIDKRGREIRGGKTYDESQGKLDRLWNQRPPNTDAATLKQSERAAMTDAEAEERYPGIKRGESVADYEKRMGTADTPDMFGGDEEAGGAAVANPTDPKDPLFDPVLDKLLKAEAAARARIASRQIPRKGKGRSGATTIPADLVDHAQILAIRMARAGVKTFKAAVEMAQKYLSVEAPEKKGQAALLARRAFPIVRKATEEGGAIDLETVDRIIREQVAEKAAKEGKKIGAREMRAKFEEMARTLRTTAKNRAETVAGMQREFVRLANQNVPLPVRGKLLGAVANAKTFGSMAAGIAKARRVLVEYEARQAFAKVKADTRRSSLAKLTNDLRTQIVGQTKATAKGGSGLFETARLAYETATNPNATVDDRETALRELLHARDAITAAIHQHRIENKVRQKDQWLDARLTKARLQNQIRTANDVLDDPDPRESAGKTPGLWRRQRIWTAGTENFLMSIDGKWDGTGEATRLGYSEISRAKSRQKTIVANALEAADKALRSAGWKDGLAELAAAATGTLGKATHETVTLPNPVLGRKTITLDEALKIQAMDQATQRQAEKGRMWNWDNDRNGEEMQLTAENFRDVRRALDMRQTNAIAVLKAVRETLKPEAFTVIKEIKGFEPIDEGADYDPRRTNPEKVKTPELTGITAELDRHLEDLGLTKERTENATIPLLMTGFVSDWLKSIDQMASIIALAHPIRNARLVLLDGGSTQTAIANRHGKAAIDRIKMTLQQAAGIDNKTPSEATKWLNAAAALVSRGSVAINSRSFLLQFGGFFKAAAETDGMVLTRGIPRMFSAGLWDRAMENSGGLRHRYALSSAALMMGLPTGTTKAESLRQSASAFAKSLAQFNLRDALGKNLDSIVDHIRLSQWFDSLVARALWAGYELDPRGRTNPEWVAEQVEKVMSRTQNPSDYHDASGLVQASKNTAWKPFLAFTGDASKNLDMIERGFNQGKTQGFKATAAVLANMIWSAAVRVGTGSGLYALAAAIGGDDKEEKKQSGKMLDDAAWSLVHDIGGSVNPIVDRLVSAAESVVKVYKGDDMTDSVVIGVIKDGLTATGQAAKDFYRVIAATSPSKRRKAIDSLRKHLMDATISGATYRGIPGGSEIRRWGKAIDLATGD